MKMQIECEPRDGYLYVKVAGQFEALRAVKLFGDSVSFAKKHDLQKILGDVTEMQGFRAGANIMGRYHVAEGIADLLPRNMQVVCLESPGQILPDKFEETVARNRGVRALVTSDMDAALEWLDV